MKAPDIDPSQLIQITDLVTKIRISGESLLNQCDYSARTKTLLLSLAKLEQKEKQVVPLPDVDEAELKNPEHLLTDLQVLVQAVKSQVSAMDTDPSAKLQLFKLQLTLLEKRKDLISEMGAVSEALRFKTLVQSWFENNLPATFLEQFLTDMENLNLLER